MPNGPKATEEVEVRTPPLPVPCPRCAAPITGDYKFCPACAYRLRTSPEDAPAPAPRSSWRTGFVVATVMAVLLACALVGVLLFHPAWIDRTAPPPPIPPTTPGAELAEPAFTVGQIPDDLIEVPPGYAYRVPLDAVPGLDPDTRENLRATLGDRDDLFAYIEYPLRVLRYEVTRGQYAEFIEDIEEHRNRVPRVWLESDQKASPEEVHLYDHIPASWVTTDSDGEARSWSVAKRDMNLPVAEVSYVDALGFCEWASGRLGIEVSIPYAMEWVRIARGGIHVDWRFPWGDRALVYACNNLGSFGRPQYVHYTYAEPRPSGGATTEGVYAMAGNVREYALDHDIELRPQVQGPPKITWKQWPTTPDTIWAYGGSFRAGIDDCTVESSRSYRKTDRSQDDVGFRVIVREPPK